MAQEIRELREARECRRDDPQRSLEIYNEYIDAHPDDAQAYFSRHLTWDQLGDREQALADCSRSADLDPHWITFLMRGRLFRELGDHERAVADFDRSHALDPEQWRTGFGPHFRADSLARLGRLEEALKDCALIREDHRMPAHSGLPGGNKQQFTAEIRRRARIARGKQA